MQRGKGSKLISILIKLYSSPVGLLLVTVLFMLEAILIQPETFEAYSLTLHGYLVGLLSFIFGFSFIYSGESFWQTVNKWKLMYLLSGVGLFVVRYGVFDLEAPELLQGPGVKYVDICSLWLFILLP